MEAKDEQYYLEVLRDTAKGVGQRYQAIFILKNFNTPQAIQYLIDAYASCHESVLLTHQIIYALGQLEQIHLQAIKPFLLRIIDDPKENNLARHEAAEAISNYFLPELPALYASHLQSQCKELRLTCEIALQKVTHSQLHDRYGKQYFGTKQPAAPFTVGQFKTFLQTHHIEDVYKQKGYLGVLLLELPLFDKYRILYLLRDQNTVEGKKLLCELISLQYYETQCSLLKHQVCFILGQIGCDQYEKVVHECIENEKEEAIVRHQALAAVASQSKDYEYLERFVKNEDQLIRESALVAQFMIKYWQE